MYHIQAIGDLSHFCWCNKDVLCGSIQTIVLEFQGLNRHEYFVQPSCQLELELGNEGILYVIPYVAPWSWMNEAAVRYTNWILDEIYRLFALDDATPVISTGFSMGGLAAIMYPVYAKRPIAACMANSPACDLTRQMTDRADLPRTILNAFIASPEGWQQGMLSRSPIHQIDQLKDIPYFVVAGGEDTEVLKKDHADRLIPMMKARGLSVIYRSLPTMKHWQINDYTVLREAVAFIKGGYQKL